MPPTRRIRKREWWLVGAITLLLAGAIVSALMIVVPGDGKSPGDGHHRATRHSEHSPAGANNPSAIAKKIASQLNCQNVAYVYDDMYFYDDMFGVNCHQKKDHVIVIRAYEHASSVPAVLNEQWKPLITPTRLLVTGDQWFAIGTRQALSQISKRVEGSSRVTHSVPTSDDNGAVEKHREETKCISFVTGALRLRALHPRKYRKQIPYLNKAYPGMRELVKSRMSGEDIAKLKEYHADSDYYRFDSYLSRFGSVVKSLCRKDA